MARLGGTSAWRSWRYRSTDDTLPSPTTAPSKLAAPRDEQDGIITVRGWSHIAVRIFGTGADTHLINCMVYGWMDNGPGELLYEFIADMGDEVYAEHLNIDDTGIIPVTMTAPREASVYTLSQNSNWAGGSGDNESEFGNAAHTTVQNNHMILPTGAYKYLRIFLGPTGATVDNAAAIWRPLKGY